MKKLFLTLAGMMSANVWMPCVAQEVREQSEEIFQVVEKMPEFPGGLQALTKYLQTNVAYPETSAQKGIQGRVIVQFVVEKDSTITNVEVGNSVDSLLDAEAIRVVEAMPKWVPGEQNGKPVRVKYTLPVTFRLGNESQEQTVEKDENEGQKEIFRPVMERPEYPGGEQALMEYIQKNLKYPSAAKKKRKQGRVIVQFVVDTDGSVINPVIINSVDPDLDKEALRLVKSMPKWKPGMQRGTPVRVKYTLPVNFRYGWQ